MLSLNETTLARPVFALGKPLIYVYDPSEVVHLDCPIRFSGRQDGTQDRGAMKHTVHRRI